MRAGQCGLAHHLLRDHDGGCLPGLRARTRADMVLLEDRAGRAVRRHQRDRGGPPSPLLTPVSLDHQHFLGDTGGRRSRFRKGRHPEARRAGGDRAVRDARGDGGAGGARPRGRAPVSSTARGTNGPRRHRRRAGSPFAAGARSTCRRRGCWARISTRMPGRRSRASIVWPGLSVPEAALARGRREPGAAGAVAASVARAAGAAPAAGVRAMARWGAQPGRGRGAGAGRPDLARPENLRRGVRDAQRRTTRPGFWNPSPGWPTGSPRWRSPARPTRRAGRRSLPHAASSASAWTASARAGPRRGGRRRGGTGIGRVLICGSLYLCRPGFSPRTARTRFHDEMLIGQENRS